MKFLHVFIIENLDSKPLPQRAEESYLTVFLDKFTVQL